MSISVIQGNHAEALGSGGSIAVTLTGITGGNGLVGAVTLADNTTLSNVQDNSSTNAALDELRDGTNEGQWMCIWSLANSPAGSRTLTAHFAGTANSNRGIQIFEENGADVAISGNGLKVTGTPTGNDSGAGTASSFDSSITTTPSINGALIFAYGEGNSNLPAAAGSFSPGFGETVNNCTTEYFVQTTAAAISPNFTMSVADKWNVVIAAYAPVPPHTVLLNGSGDPRLLVNGN